MAKQKLESVSCDGYLESSIISHLIQNGYGSCLHINMSTIDVQTNCPCCGKVLVSNTIPQFVFNNINIIDSEKSKTYNSLAVYLCNDCKQFFCVWEKHDRKGQPYACTVFPKTAGTVFSENIESLSNDFVEIYHQAEQAEILQLNKICGMAYRRSLEFLIDAYLYEKSIYVDTKAPLSQKIAVIDDSNIQILAERTAWLGNDHAHIISDHPEYSVEDIKDFIIAITKCIDANIAVQRANAIEHRT